MLHWGSPGHSSCVPGHSQNIPKYSAATPWVYITPAPRLQKNPQSRNMFYQSCCSHTCISYVGVGSQVPLCWAECRV